MKAGTGTSSGCPDSLHMPTAVATGVCELWWANIACGEMDFALLDLEERRRAAGMRLGCARSTYIASRTAQRLVLARYLGMPAADVIICRDCEHCGRPHGRPVIAAAQIDFSVSHTAKWVVVAVVKDGRIGVDVEDRVIASADAIEAALSPRELRVLAELPDADRRIHLVRAWTRKEAVTKLTGHGLAASVRHLDVSGSVAVWRQAPRGSVAAEIRLINFTGPTDHIGAIAVTGQFQKVRHLRLSMRAARRSYISRQNELH